MAISRGRYWTRDLPARCLHSTLPDVGDHGPLILLHSQGYDPQGVLRASQVPPSPADHPQEAGQYYFAQYA
eukprot:7394236-Pyramimonas_sp.AAC.1